MEARPDLVPRDAVGRVAARGTDLPMLRNLTYVIRYDIVSRLFVGALRGFLRRPGCLALL